MRNTCRVLEQVVANGAGQRTAQSQQLWHPTLKEPADFLYIKLLTFKCIK
jgi:hypothetical protein